MARLPLYEQQTRPQGTQVTPQDMGANVGVQMQNMGNTLTDIGMNIQRRNDVLETVRGFSTFDQEAMTTLNALNATEDIANPATINQYRQGLDQMVQKTLEGYQGSRFGRQKLQAQLENQKAQYVKSALAAQIKAQHSMIGRQVEQKVNELGVVTALAPDQFPSAMVDFESTIDQLSDAIPQDQIEEYRALGRGKLASSMISGFLERGDFKSARMALTDPEVGKFLPPEASRRFAMGIAVDEAKAVKAAQAAQNHILTWEARVGRTLTPEERTRVKSLPLSDKNKTASQKIAEYELITGGKAPQAVVDRILLGQDEGPDYGNSMAGRARTRIEENMSLYMSGQMNPDELRRFEADINAAFAPVYRRNEITGDYELLSPAIPPSYEQAFAQGSRLYGRAPTSVGAGGPPIMGTPTGTMAEQSQAPTQPSGQTAAPATTPSPTESGEPGVAGQAGDTIWSQREQIAGVVPSVASAAGRVPGLGEMVDGGGRFAQSRQFAETQSRELIRALSQSGRYGATEMKAIESEVNIAGQSLDTVSAYTQRLIAIDKALATRVQNEQRNLQDPGITKEARKNALDVINTIQNFRRTLGVPPRVESKSQLRNMVDQGQIKPGDVFLGPGDKPLLVPESF